jgi:aspartyl-tRNA(Asn)/glutamyl-tRNA(Gln) amidotransferase subunit A
MTGDAAPPTALALACGFASGGCGPVEALEQFLARIDALNPELNAVVTLDRHGAHEAARASAARWHAGEPLSPLDGVPITVKDNLLVRGLRATWGSALYEHFVPDRDELPVARLRAAGLVILGKTNVPEFTLRGYTDNALFGCTRNPWQPELTPGGSSGGAVASVASAMAPLALATDGGGSIRRPASHTGLIGHKPTVGRIARDGGFPVILHDFEVVGPIARTIPDAAAMMAVLVDQAQPWRPPRERPSQRQRIAYMPRFGDAPVDPQIASSVAAAAQDMSALGHKVDALACPLDLDQIGEAFRTVSAAGLAWLLRGFSEGSIARCGQEMQVVARYGASLSAADYVRALTDTARLKRQLADFFGRYDMILTPATAALPWPAVKSHPTEIAGIPVGPRGHAIFTAFANLSGCPALAIPTSAAADGLPIGLQLVAAWGCDELLFEVGAEFLALRSWSFQHPTPGHPVDFAMR